MDEPKLESVELPVIFQPDLLGKDELIQILKPRCIKRDLQKMEKSVLVDLFNRLALPLPQRQYNDSWRGRELTLKRKKHEASRRKQQSKSSSSAEKPRTSNGLTELYKSVLSEKNKSFPSNRSPPEKNEPSKPLPDQINYERKKIKLSGISPRKCHNDSDKIIKHKSESSTSDRQGSIDKRKLSDPNQVDKDVKRKITYDSKETSKQEKRKRPLITGP